MLKKFNIKKKYFKKPSIKKKYFKNLIKQKTKNELKVYLQEKFKCISQLNTFFLRFNVKKDLFRKYDFFNYKNINFLKIRNYENLNFKNFKKKNIKQLSNFKILKSKKLLFLKSKLIKLYFFHRPRPIIKKIYQNFVPLVINNLKNLVIERKKYKIRESLRIKKKINKNKKKNKKKLIYKYYTYLINNINFKIISTKKKLKSKKLESKEIIHIKNKIKLSYHKYYLFLKFQIKYWNEKFRYLKLCWWYWNILGKSLKPYQFFFYNFIKKDFLIPLIITIKLKKKNSVLLKTINNLKNNNFFIDKKKKMSIFNKKKILLFSKYFFSTNVELNFNIINIRITCNNTTIIVSKSNGLIIFALTAGILQFKGSKKNTFVATLTVARKIYSTIIDKKILPILKIVYKSSKRRAKLKHLLRLFCKAFKKKKIKILSLINNTSLPYNGSIKKKKRR